MFEKLKSAVRENLFPSSFTCDICGVESFGGNLCPACKKTVIFNDGHTCPVCGRRTSADEICIECKSRLPWFKRAVSPLVYDGGAVALIGKFKGGTAYLKDYFAELLKKPVTALPYFDCIVPVPMTKKSKRIRGYDQTKLLADGLSALTEIPVVCAVKKVRETPVQKGLGFKERAENLKGCFKVEDRALVKGKTVLVLDDVLTTGATAGEMTKTLLKAGAEQVFLATVASVEYSPLQRKNG